eukprot:747424-Hanusia_phi.AAC.2
MCAATFKESGNPGILRRTMSCSPGSYIRTEGGVGVTEASPLVLPFFTPPPPQFTSRTPAGSLHPTPSTTIKRPTARFQSTSSEILE